MADTEPVIKSIAELLKAPEYQGGRPSNPKVWTDFLTKGIIQDQHLRRIPPQESLYNLFPNQSEASTPLMTRYMKTFRMLNLKRIPDFQSKTFAYIDGLWRNSSTGRNNNVHRLALAFWLESQPSPKSHPKP